MIKIRNNIFFRILFLLLIFIINVSYSPVFFDSEGLSIFPFKWVIELLAVLFLMLSLFFRCPQTKFIWHYLIFAIIITATVLLYYSLDLNVSLGEIREILIPFMALTAGSYIFKYHGDYLFLRTIFFVSIVSALIVGLQQIFINIGGFSINEQYLTNSKNSLGGILAINTILASLELFGLYKKSLSYIVFLSISIIVLILEMLTIRSRLDLIVSFFLLFVIFLRYLNYRNSKYKVISAFVLVFLLLALLSISSVQDYIQSSFLLNREDDVLSGRYERIEKALEILSFRPFSGNLFIFEYVPWVHNYFLLKISSFGLFFGLPWIVFYLYIFAFIIGRLYRNKSISLYSYGIYLTLIPFLISLGEPTYPFGPGTVNYLPYLLLGFSLEYMQSADSDNYPSERDVLPKI